MLRVKICGVTRVADAVAAAEEGADYVGLIFARSPRQVSPKTARDIIRHLPRGVQAVGVFMNHPLEEVRAAVQDAGLPLVQLHGAETAVYAQAVGVPFIKTFDSFTDAALQRLKAYDAHAYLVDLPKGAGPRGRARIDHEWALLAKRFGKVLLAGKLDPDNVGEMVRRVRPWGVDTCRCTETAPGVKDRARIRAFIDAARTAHKESHRIKVRTR